MMVIIPATTGGPNAHGWDPSIPTDAGVYDGLQEEPRYVCRAR